MIPLAQYFADADNEDFIPFRSVPARKPAPKPMTRAAASPDPSPAAASVRSLKAMPQRTAETAAPVRAVTEPRIGLREVEAERAGWAAEREAHALALAEAVEAARLEDVATGRRLGREALEAETREHMETALAAAGAEHAAALATARGLWTEEQGDRLADLMILQVAILEETIKMSLNNVLRPLALDARRRQTLDELVGAVKTIALDGMAYKIAASGPADLLGALEARLGDHARLLSFEADETQADIRIDADNTVIESRLSSWRLALEEALS